MGYRSRTETGGESYLDIDAFDVLAESCIAILTFEIKRTLNYNFK